MIKHLAWLSLIATPLAYAVPSADISSYWTTPSKPLAKPMNSFTGKSSFAPDFSRLDAGIRPSSNDRRCMSYALRLTRYPQIKPCVLATQSAAPPLVRTTS